MVNRFENIPSRDLYDSLVIYIEEYGKLTKQQKDSTGCKAMIDAITAELKKRNEYPGA